MRLQYKRPLVWTAVPAIVILLSAGAPPVALQAQEQRDDQEDRLQELTDRVAALERAIAKDLYGPAGTVTGRLEALERGLRDLERLREAEIRVDQRQVEALRRDVAASQRQMQMMEQRLRIMDQEQRVAGGAVTGHELRDLRREVDRLNRSANDLSTRISRLESRR